MYYHDLVKAGQDNYVSIILTEILEKFAAPQAFGVTVPKISAEPARK